MILCGFSRDLQEMSPQYFKFEHDSFLVRFFQFIVQYVFSPIPVGPSGLKAWVSSRSSAVIAGLNPAGGMDVCLLWVLSGRGLCDGLITRPEEFYRLWCVIVCDQMNNNNPLHLTWLGTQRLD